MAQRAATRAGLAASHAFVRWGPPVTKLMAPSEVGATLCIGGANRAKELIDSGLAGPVYCAGGTCTARCPCVGDTPCTGTRYVRADDVWDLAARPAVTAPHPAALVLRVAPAFAVDEPDTGRRFAGWSTAADPDEVLDGVRGYWRIADDSAEAVVHTSMPVVVTVKGFVVLAFLAAGFSRVERLGVAFEVGEADPSHHLLAPFAERRLITGPGGAVHWLPGAS